MEIVESEDCRAEARRRKALCKIMARALQTDRFEFERALWNHGVTRVAGVDEAGRGPLAGPVVAAACILPDDLKLPGINDSKQLSAEQRERLFRLIQENPAILKGVGMVEALIIDQVNILQATLLAMVAAVAKLQQTPDYVLVDGNQPPPLTMPC